MTDNGPLASVIIVGYNSREDLLDCLSSVCSQSIDDYEVIFVDNDSDDNSVEYVRNEFPEVRVIANTTNRWYAGGNNDGLIEADGQYLVVLNPDVVVEEDWLEHLIEPLQNDENIGLTTSRIVQFDDRTKLNTCGNIAHFTGLGFCRGLDDPIDNYTEPQYIGAVSGCSFAVRYEIYERYGGFDETFEHYLEDVDISFRARLAGYDILYVPDSIVYHKYEFSLAPWKLFNMERNRYLILLKHLKYKTILFISPALVMTELLIWGYALLSGLDAVVAKAGSWRWLIGNINLIRQKRRRVQAWRERSDSAVLKATDIELPLEQFDLPSPVVKVANRLLTAAYRPWHWLGTRNLPNIGKDTG